MEDFTLKFYPKGYNSDKIEKIWKTVTGKDGKTTMDAKALFWPSMDWYNNAPHTFHRLVLVEAINNKNGKKAYRILPVYEVHKQGLLDKSENKISGNSIFRMNIDIQ